MVREEGRQGTTQLQEVNCMVHNLCAEEEETEKKRKKKKKRKRPQSRAANRARHPTTPVFAWTIDELCTVANCSRSFYEEEKRNGRGARELRYGRAIRVTPDDGRAWVESHRVA
jgi:hypothetical protein